MNIASIVVPTIALQGGVAAYLAGGSDGKVVATETVGPCDRPWQDRPAQATNNTFICHDNCPEATHRADAVERGLVAAGEPAWEAMRPVDIGSDDRARRRGSTNVVRYGVTNPMTKQKRPERRT